MPGIQFANARRELALPPHSSSVRSEIKVFTRWVAPPIRGKLEMGKKGSMSTILDTAQLEDVTMGDAELMREIMHELVVDTATQLENLRLALVAGDQLRSARVAHSAKGACANLGARALADLFLTVERKAGQGDMNTCHASLPQLAGELDRLRERIQSL